MPTSSPVFGRARKKEPAQARGAFLLKPLAAGLDAYLAADSVVQVHHPAVFALREQISTGAVGTVEKARRLYAFVRDRFPHTFDIGGKEVAVTASDVLRLGHGVCFAKSHLLAAFLRGAGIPAGFCYQRLILDEPLFPYLVLHGMAAAYLKGRWVRLDARGNKPGVNAQFSLERERLAFSVRPAFGEADLPELLPAPDAGVLKALRKSRTAEELRRNIPAALFDRTDESDKWTDAHPPATGGEPK